MQSDADDAQVGGRPRRKATPAGMKLSDLSKARSFLGGAAATRQPPPPKRRPASSISTVPAASAPDRLTPAHDAAYGGGGGGRGDSASVLSDHFEEGAQASGDDGPLDLPQSPAVQALTALVHHQEQSIRDIREVSMAAQKQLQEVVSAPTPPKGTNPFLQEGGE